MNIVRYFDTVTRSSLQATP